MVIQVEQSWVELRRVRSSLFPTTSVKWEYGQEPNTFELGSFLKSWAHDIKIFGGGNVSNDTEEFQLWFQLTAVSGLNWTGLDGCRMKDWLGWHVCSRLGCRYKDNIWNLLSNSSWPTEIWLNTTTFIGSHLSVRPQSQALCLLELELEGYPLSVSAQFNSSIGRHFIKRAGWQVAGRSLDDDGIWDQWFVFVLSKKSEIQLLVQRQSSHFELDWTGLDWAGRVWSVERSGAFYFNTLSTETTESETLFAKQLELTTFDRLWALQECWDFFSFRFFQPKRVEGEKKKVIVQAASFDVWVCVVLFQVSLLFSFKKENLFKVDLFACSPASPSNIGTQLSAYHLARSRLVHFFRFNESIPFWRVYSPEKPIIVQLFNSSFALL